VEESVLNILRKHARSWWIKAILIAVALSFVIGFGILNRMSSADRSRYVVRVGDNIVTPDEFSDLMMRSEQEYYQNHGTEMTDDERINLQDTIIKDRIDRIVEVKEANRLGLIVSDDEVAENIAGEPGFINNGAFDYDIYTQYLDYVGLTEKMFEAEVRENLLVRKLKEIVTDSVKVSDDEIIEMAQSQGMTVTSLDDLTPDDRDYYARIALAVKRFTAYRTFLDSLKAAEEIDINQDYLLKTETQ
jgi:peptidyl-prolyl cis-trans isomerase D